MNAAHLTRFANRATVLLTLCSLLACNGEGDKSGGDKGGGDVKVSETRGDGAKMTATDREAADFVRSKLAEHWLKGSDGWTTQFILRNYFGEPLDGVPDTLFKQYRDFKFNITPETLTEAQRLNGADYRGAVNFEATAVRYYRTVETYEGPQGWSNWQDDPFPAFLAVERRNGEWLISESDLFSNPKPDSAAVAAAM